MLAPLLILSLGAIGLFPPSASVTSAAEAKQSAATMKCCCGGATAECCSRSCCKIDRQQESPPVPKRPAVRRIELTNSAGPAFALATPLYVGKRSRAISPNCRDLAVDTLQSEWVRIQV